MSALEFSRGRVARCIRNAVSRRDACVGSPPIPRKWDSHSARHVSALLASCPLGALSRAPRDLFLNADLFSPEGFVLTFDPAGSLDYREIFSYGNQYTFSLASCWTFASCSICFRPSLEMRETRRACVFTQHRYMQISMTLCRDTTFKFSKAAIFCENLCM